LATAATTDQARALAEKAAHAVKITN
jgi:hypothetical protein